MRETIYKVVVNVCRLLLAIVFVFSGFVKAVDPMGTAYKLTDYLNAMHLQLLAQPVATVTASVALSATEFCCGLFLLLGIRRRLSARVAMALLLVMTPLTLWLAVANPVSDCGCFGDAVVLSNWQTFWKNVVLLGAAAIVAAKPKAMFRFVSQPNQWIIINYAVLFIIAVAGWSLYDLPLYDFRPYHVGANIREGMTIPEGEQGPQFETTFILEKDGEQREFTLDDYPDSTWTFVDSRTVQTSEGYVPPIHDFSLVNDEGDDITEEVLSDTSYVFLLVAHHLENADDSRPDLINELYEYCQQQGYGFYGLTASSEKAIDRWRDITGAEYPFCTVDDITLKTVIRSNPGLVLLKNGTVVGKWSHNDLPQMAPQEAAKPLEQLKISQTDNDGVATKTARLLLWFVLPLSLLVMADRLWMWTRWLRRSKKKKEEKVP